MTPETQIPAAAPDGFVTYDEFSGPDLDAARWTPARLPLPTGGEHLPLDPNAELAVGEGEVRVMIPRFSLSHDAFQSVDSAKYLTFSTGEFELPPDRPATFAADLAVKNIGGDPGDFRRGIAAFHVFDLEVSKRVFSVCGTSTRVFAMHEHLPLGGGGPGELFYPRGRVAVRGLRRRLHPASRVRDHARPEQIDRGLARRRPQGVRGPRHLDPRTRSHRVRDLDDAADPGRSQSLARRAGHERAVAPVPRTRRRRVSRHRTGDHPSQDRTRLRPRRGHWVVCAPSPGCTTSSDCLFATIAAPRSMSLSRTRLR